MPRRRFLFTDYNRLSSVGGETSMAEMIATLSDACEREFGFLATRLFRVFKTDEKQGMRTRARRSHARGLQCAALTEQVGALAGKSKWKKTCCVPSFVLFALVMGCLVSGVALMGVFRVGGDNRTVNGVLMALGSVVGVAVLLNCRTWWRVSDSVLNSQRKRLHRAANKMHKLKSEGFMKVRSRIPVALEEARRTQPIVQRSFCSLIHRSNMAVVQHG